MVVGYHKSGYALSVPCDSERGYVREKEEEFRKLRFVVESGSIKIEIENSRGVTEWDVAAVFWPECYVRFHLLQFSQKVHSFFGICMRKRTNAGLTAIRQMEYNILTEPEQCISTARGLNGRHSFVTIKNFIIGG